MLTNQESGLHVESIVYQVLDHYLAAKSPDYPAVFQRLAQENQAEFEAVQQKASAERTPCVVVVGAMAASPGRVVADRAATSPGTLLAALDIAQLQWASPWCVCIRWFAGRAEHSVVLPGLRHVPLGRHTPPPGLSSWTGAHGELTVCGTRARTCWTGRRRHMAATSKRLRMVPNSPAVDFSFDFQDLDLRPVENDR